MPLSLERLREVLSYDRQTGVFTWNVLRSCKAVPGAIAGSRTPKGYCNIQIDGAMYKAHRLAWFYCYGQWPLDQIDHEDCDKFNNAIGNLREASTAQNMQNRSGPHRDNRSGVLGVHKHHNKFVSRITIDGDTRYLGLYDTAEEAHEMYLEAKKELHPFGVTR